MGLEELILSCFGPKRQKELFDILKYAFNCSPNLYKLNFSANNLKSDRIADFLTCLKAIPI